MDKMTRVQVNNLLVQVVEAKAVAAAAQSHYEKLYHQFWNEIQQHYPIEPRNQCIQKDTPQK